MPLRRRPRAPTASTTAGPSPAPTMMCSVSRRASGRSPTSSASAPHPRRSAGTRPRARGSPPACSRGGTCPIGCPGWSTLRLIPRSGKRRLPSKSQNAPSPPVSRQRISRALTTNQPSPPGRSPNFVISRGASGTTIRTLTDVQKSLPVAERPRRPEWMKVRAPSADSRYFDVKKLIHGHNLHTICEEARCPNISECWGRGTATFQILGDTCTRACRYCYVKSGKPEHPPDPLEPLRLAHTAAQMELKHVVVTSVDRDDLPDKGAGHYAATIRALKAKVPRGLGRGADARLPRLRGGGAADRPRRAARGLQPQHRDRSPPASQDARREGRLRQGALAARPREGGRRTIRC